MKKFIKENWLKVVIVIIVIVLISLISKLFTKTNIVSTQTEPTTEKPANTQIANPASVNCIKKGGKLSIVDQAEGQVGMCTLPNGTVCEEWAYFRGECQ